jgi:hypothetical protein
VYIKISEEEIADDYPMPKQYEMQDQEIDELVVNGDEAMLCDVDPECLPTMVCCISARLCAITPHGSHRQAGRYAPTSSSR